MHWLRRTFVGAATVWSMALLLAPVAASRPQPSSIGYMFALVMYAAGSLICHQRPERSFQLFGAQLPVCARCLGIYAGAAVTACLLSMRTAKAVRIEADPGVAQNPGQTFSAAPDFSPASRTVLLVSALPAAATLLFEWATGHTPDNWTRAASGVPLGAAVAWIVSGAAARVNYSVVPATAAERTQSSSLVLLCLASWAIPGAGHLWLGRRSKGLTLLAALTLMFAIGLGLHGQLVPTRAIAGVFDLSEPLAGLMCIADLGIGALYFAAGALGYGAGDVRAVTYEYGNTFLIVAGLLNFLVVIDAYDIAMGRK